MTVTPGTGTTPEWCAVWDRPRPAHPTLGFVELVSMTPCHTGCVPVRGGRRKPKGGENILYKTNRWKRRG